MEDYDQIDEEQASDEQEITEGAEIPQPILGQVDYSRSDEGSEVAYVKPLTPRAGGDSIIGHSTIQENQILLDKMGSVGKGEGTNNPSYIGEREEFVNRSNASFSITNAARQKDQSEVY